MSRGRIKIIARRNLDGLLAKFCNMVIVVSGEDVFDETLDIGYVKLDENGVCESKDKFTLKDYVALIRNYCYRRIT